MFRSRLMLFVPAGLMRDAVLYDENRLFIPKHAWREGPLQGRYFGVPWRAPDHTQLLEKTEDSEQRGRGAGAAPRSRAVQLSSFSSGGLLIHAFRSLTWGVGPDP